MSRIRSLKPEWLEDERLAAASDEARLLSVALILLADDHGRGRAHISFLVSRVWPYSTDRREPASKAMRAIKELTEIGFVRVYEVGSQRYYEIKNWAKHQRIDNAGKSHVPPPVPEAPEVLAEVRGGSPNSAASRGGSPLDLDLDLDRDQDLPEECAEVSQADSPPAAPPVLVIPCSGKPQTWELHQAKVTEWQASFPGVDVMDLCRRARQWQIDNPHTRKTARRMAGWISSVWLGRDQDKSRAPPKQGDLRVGHAPAPSDAEWAQQKLGPQGLR